jgi:acyl carrier protein
VNDDTFEAKVLRLIAEAVPPKFRKNPITVETRFKQDLGLDSIGMLALLFRFEQSFGLDLATIELETTLAQLRTVGDALVVGRSILERARVQGTSRA